MYRERTETKLTHWDNNYYPLNWDHLSPKSFKTAIDEANRVWTETGNEEEAQLAGMTKAKQEAEISNIKLWEI